MPKTIVDIPYELLSDILEEACLSGLKITRGLLDSTHRLRYCAKESEAPDSKRWAASNSVRQVNRIWHQWALTFALRDLYIFDWRGSHRFLQSGARDTRSTPVPITKDHRKDYLDPLLQKTAHLFQCSPEIGYFTKRIWFDSCHSAADGAVIFSILRRCKALVEVCLPSTMLWHGSVEDWSQLFPAYGDDTEGPLISSLQIRAASLTQSSLTRATSEEKWNDKGALKLGDINFGRLRRLKFFGFSKFMSPDHLHLIDIARTATGLRELRVVNTLPIMTRGIEALVDSSLDTLENFEFLPADALFPGVTPYEETTQNRHLNHKVAQCTRLRTLTLGSTYLCRDLLNRTVVKWNCPIQIHLRYNIYGEPDVSSDDLWYVIGLARKLMALSPNSQLDIEIALPIWLFEARHQLVHGSFESYSSWYPQSLPDEIQMRPSGKTVQDASGYLTKHRSCIPEQYFKDAVATGDVYL